MHPWLLRVEKQLSPKLVPVWRIGAIPNGDSKAGSLSVAHPAGPGKRLSRKIVDGKILICDCALFLPLEDFGSD
jgi:hypothetical protein